MNFIVRILYDPGVPAEYLVEDVSDARAARARVLALFGYDPGVPVEITQVPINRNKAERFSNLGRCLD